ncbi:MAG: 30S ribosomal protein S14 [Myxococcota bacterium]
MASKANIASNLKRKKLAAKFAEQRAALKKIIKDPDASDEDKDEAQRKLQGMPRDASKTRVRNRCAVTGRPRAYYRKFGLSRIALRELGLRGEIPGLTKSSW